MQQEFFVLYDYGQGGLWAILAADSAEQIRRRFPQVQVFDGAPPMLGPGAVAAIRKAGVQSLDGGPLQGWLANLEA